jgi:hypothetical protein
MRLYVLFQNWFDSTESALAERRHNKTMPPPIGAHRFRFSRARGLAPLAAEPGR